MIFYVSTGFYEHLKKCRLAPWCWKDDPLPGVRRSTHRLCHRQFYHSMIHNSAYYIVWRTKLMIISTTRRLLGFARVPSNYTSSPFHMHPVHNCHHMKSCHPPVKQYITTHHNTDLIYPFCNTKVAMARAALCVVLCTVYHTGQCPPQSTSLEVSFPPDLRSSHAPPLLLSLARLLPLSSARFLPPLFPSLRPCLRSFLTHSLPQPALSSSTPAPTLRHIIASSLPPLAPSLPTLPLLPPSNRPSFLAPGKLHCIVSRLSVHDTDTMECSRQKKVSFQWPAVRPTFIERAPTTNPFLTKSKQIRRSTRATNTQTRSALVGLPFRGRRRRLPDPFSTGPTRSKDRGLLSYNIDYGIVGEGYT